MRRCRLNGSNGQHWRRSFRRRSLNSPWHRTLKSGSALQRVRRSGRATVSPAGIHGQGPPSRMSIGLPRWGKKWGLGEPGNAMQLIQRTISRSIAGLPLRQPARVTMTTLEDIEKAVAELPADQLARFRAWFEEFEAARFDQKIERDAKAGRLDQLAEQALADYRAGRAHDQ